jgi:hypothetical protein
MQFVSQQPHVALLLPGSWNVYNALNSRQPPAVLLAHILEANTTLMAGTRWPRCCRGVPVGDLTNTSALIVPYSAPLTMFRYWE